MAEKDVVYALQLLHTVQVKRECINFASFTNEKFNQLSPKEKQKLWNKYINNIK
jgi:hypothetical protein